MKQIILKDSVAQPYITAANFPAGVEVKIRYIEASDQMVFMAIDSIYVEYISYWVSADMDFQSVMTNGLDELKTKYTKELAHLDFVDQLSE